MSATPIASPIAFTDEELAGVRYNADGLVAAIVQEEGTGQVLMMAWMNPESLRRTLETGRTWFWSRSRQEFWCKGETSGDRQFVRAAYYDCDGDTLLFVVEQEGRGACHTGERSCFYRAFGAKGSAAGRSPLERDRERPVESADPDATPGPV
jgi:phosphoribosyl-AMP cyclohydrolase/phosphoribosyl-ATP pyrophosphohydrolase/phosphoribosyl-AMP cyclohydrolase